MEHGIQKHLPQGGVFGGAKCKFARFAKDRFDGAFFPMLDKLIQVPETPTQLFPQNRSHTGFARTHKADQKSRPDSSPAPPRRCIWLRTRAQSGSPHGAGNNGDTASLASKTVVPRLLLLDFF